MVLYQEQVIELLLKLQDLHPVNLTACVRSMTKFRSHKEMESIGEDFIAKAAANGVERGIAGVIFSYIVGYAGYGFCEAHAGPLQTRPTAPLIF